MTTIFTDSQTNQARLIADEMRAAIIAGKGKCRTSDVVDIVDELAQRFDRAGDNDWKNFLATQIIGAGLPIRYGEDGIYGDLHDYASGEYLRAATKAERDASRSAGPEGVITVDSRSVYVEE